jgi:hypothetical protein
MGAPPKGGRGKAGPFTGAPVNGLIIPPPAGEGSIEYMIRALLAQPEGVYVSREQLAQLVVDAGYGRSGLTGALHTARCQTGRQGTQEHGFVFSTGLASDGEKGYNVDKEGSERNVTAQIVVGGVWAAQPKPVAKRAARGFPWALVTPEAKAAGFVGVPTPEQAAKLEAAKPKPRSRRRKGRRSKQPLG